MSEQSIKSAMESDDTSAKISDAFRFPSRLATAAHQVHTVRAGVDARANVFEAYVAGLLIDKKDPAIVRAHLRVVYRPLVTHQYEHIKAANGPVNRSGCSPAFGPHVAASSDSETINWISMLKEYNDSARGGPRTIT